MKSILAAQFWNEEVSSSRSLDGVAHTLPSEAPPLGMVAGTRLSRSQQLLLLQRTLWVPCTPSYAVDADNRGGLVLDRVLGSTGGDNWWATLTGRVRAQRLFGKVGHHQTSTTNAAPDTPLLEPKKKWQEYAGRLLDSSLYALCLRSRIQLGSRTSLSGASELDSLPRQLPSDQQAVGDDRTPWRGRVALRHKLAQHQILVEAAFHECFVDREARYWDVPQALSVDLASQGGQKGLRYRLGIHHSTGVPLECGREDTAQRVPLGALPGMNVQAAASLEKSLDIWKGSRIGTQKSYSLLEARPHVSLSGIVGGFLGARLEPLLGSESSRLVNGSHDLSISSLSISADLFGSLGLHTQFGLFQRLLFDYTKLGVRIDIGDTSPFAQAAMQSGFSNSNRRDERGHSSLVLSLQQQVIGPLRARVDSRVSLDLLDSKELPHVQEITYGLDYPLEALGATKVCVWYSPTRREGMAEFRILER